MLFCPTCGNLLLIQTGGSRRQFFCQTCPFQYNIMKPYKKETRFKRKELDDVLGGEDAWKNVDSTEATCPKCEHKRAYYMQIQTRSADEPMTIYYRCCNPDCHHQWNEK
ncbi:3777_t:CDS:2 [Ambispora leptoticha]|uniref:DNA-directed RNA polymerase subunit n=2 Tax=Ambispora TaxID=453566 RepID=A0A9N8ZXD7_9GLOM|nr:13034_t:CDS:2 [Ambispora gerdemannii]CAG8526306.1 3777_t:CDS:2 [Ambispora leptoticha]